jgi:hypothetical protein
MKPLKDGIMLQMCDIKLGEGDVMPPKAKWDPLMVKECEVRCVLTQSYANHLWNQIIHQTLTKKMMLKARG